MVRLWVDVRQLSRLFSNAPKRKLTGAAAVGVILMLSAGSPAWPNSHETSRVRFVDYSTEAFEAARRENKPVFLLISAVWCYWCKYFNRNTLETDEVATYLNRNYLSIFVDHDRRMDLTRRYARGLPTIVLLAPDGQIRQSFAGALAKKDFLDVLRRVADDVRMHGAVPASRTPRGELGIPPPEAVTKEAYQRLREGMRAFVSDRVDTVYGGFGSGDKYPHPRLLRYLLAQYESKRDRRDLTVVESSLDAILKSLYDPFEGGFFHYAEGREWRQPHHEKLLHINASLAHAFDDAYRITRKPRYKQAADATVAYLRRTLYDVKDGGFYGSQTADPLYYRLAAQARRAAVKPPVNRDKITAWNAETALTFLALGQSASRKDFLDVAHRTLDFIRRSLITEKGALQFYDAKTARGQLSGQLEANAWAALAFLEGYRVLQVDIHRQAAEHVLTYARLELFDAAHGIFVDDRQAPLSLEANGIMAEAFIRTHRLTGRSDDLEIAKRILGALGGVARAILVEEVDTAGMSQGFDAVFYLTAYGSIVDRP